MYNINSSSLNGGNSLNLIRISSVDKWINILESDMNGTIDISSIYNRKSRWNYFNAHVFTDDTLKDYTTTQTNTSDTCRSSVNYRFSIEAFVLVSKNKLSGPIDKNTYSISSFRPIIGIIG